MKLPLGHGPVNVFKMKTYTTTHAVIRKCDSNLLFGGDDDDDDD